MALIFSMGLSLDGYITDAGGAFDWSEPSEDQFRFHIEEVRALGAAILGRKLYETMLVWETDPDLQSDEDSTTFAEIWSAIPKVVFSRSLDVVQGNARLARGTLEEEVAAVLASTDKDVEIGGATLTAAALELDLVDEFRLFRAPVLVGGGLPYFPPVREHRRLELLDTRTFANQVVYSRYRRLRG